MRCYLFDTNIWSKWFKEDEGIIKKVDALPQECILYLSVISWGEAIYGGAVDKHFDSESYRSFVESKTPLPYDIDRHVAKTYGIIRAQLFEEYAPGEKKKKKRRPEQLIDPITSQKLGIQENDLWITAQALTRNFTLVTTDKKMRRIFDLVKGTLSYEIWEDRLH